MEASLLTRAEFWDDDAPLFMGDSPAVSGPGLVFFRTSGSTGEPKWIGLSRAALQVSAAAVNRHLGVEASDCWALALPVEHVGGFGVAARAWQAGCRLVQFDRKWEAGIFTAWLEGTRASHLSLVPAQVHDLVAARLRAPQSLRAIVVGGGALGEATGRTARELGWPVLASYGMTEAASQVATQGIELLDLPYVPQPLEVLPCWDARTDESGRISIRGPALFSGSLIRGPDGWKYEERRGEWFAGSDTGSVDGRYLHFGGRSDTRVKILGELVDPVAVELELLAFSVGGLSPGCLAVVAVEDARAGHKLVLVHETGIDPEVLKGIVDAYHAACPGFRRIRDLVAVRRIPCGPLGKPLRRDLARMVEKHQN